MMLQQRTAPCSFANRRVQHISHTVSRSTVAKATAVQTPATGAAAFRSNSCTCKCLTPTAWYA